MLGKYMIDSHAHILSDQFDSDREELITRAASRGLSGWIEVGTNVEESKKAVALASEYANLFASVGVHPDEIGAVREEDWNVLETLASHKKVCAIGEVGFDTYRDGTIAAQEPALRRFIALAQTVHKPVIFHVRSGNGVDAHNELLRVLSSCAPFEVPPGVIHTFSGTLQQAHEYISHGMMISFSGVITFKNAESLREIVRTIPLDSILVETDCPYLTPEPHRGQRNEPEYVRYVLQRIAQVRGVSFEDIERVTGENTCRLFQFPLDGS